MIKNGKIYLIMIVLLTAAPLANLGAFSDFNNTLPNIQHFKIHDDVSYSKGDKLAVSERVLIVVNGIPYNQDQNISNNLVSEEYNKIKIVTVKEITNTITTMESIFNFKRIRSDGKSIILYNPILDANEAVKPTIDNILNNKLVNNIDRELQDTLFKSAHVIISDTNKEFFVITNVVAQLGNNLLLKYDISSPNDLTLLVLLVPLSGYILLRSEEEKIKLNKNQIFSFCFILILVSSSAVTPFAISQNYWGMAFAELQNQTSVSQNNTVSNGTAPNTGSITVPTNETNSTVS